MPTFSVLAAFPAAYFQGPWMGPLVDQVVGTGILVALIAALVDHRNQAPEGNVPAPLIGLAVAVIGISYGVNAGYAINPARGFGPRNPARGFGPRLFACALGWGRLAFPGDFGAFTGYWWIPIAGPLAEGMAGILWYDFFTGQILAARQRVPVPAPEPGQLPGPGGAEAHSRRQRG